jgi:hypothetical protein
MLCAIPAGQPATTPQQQYLEAQCIQVLGDEDRSPLHNQWWWLFRTQGDTRCYLIYMLGCDWQWYHRIDSAYLGFRLMLSNLKSRSSLRIWCCNTNIVIREVLLKIKNRLFCVDSSVELNHSNGLALPILLPQFTHLCLTVWHYILRRNKVTRKKRWDKLLERMNGH